LQNLAESGVRELGGSVILLAPGAVPSPAEWRRAVRQLIAAPTLAAIRWIIVDCSGHDAGPFGAGLPLVCEHLDATPDPRAELGLLGELIAGMKTAPDGAGGQRLAGLAGPDEAPPLRRGEAAPDPSAAREQLSGNGLEGVADTRRMQRLRIATLEAAHAFGEGQPSIGIRHQTAARDLCLDAGLAELAVVLELSLGAHLLQADVPAQALDVIEQATDRAREAQAWQLVVQALMARGGALLSLGRRRDAATAYRQAAELAGQRAEVSALLAIECWRTCGQLLLGMGEEQLAVRALRRALELADETPAVERIGSSAPVAARDLAALYEKRGLSVQARSLLDQAQAWEEDVSALPV
jgi:Flp pilus assembly protein TadD